MRAQNNPLELVLQLPKMLLGESIMTQSSESFAQTTLPRATISQSAFRGLLTGLVWLSLGLCVGASAAPPGTSDEIRDRIAPVGKLCRAGDECGSATAAAPSGPRDGKAVYDGFCFVCHATGVGGAPIYADSAAWTPRIDKGMDALWETMQNGLGAMPAKGTCINCSDEELRASLDYMIESVN